MPRPDSMRPAAPVEKVPCTTKRGYAHHTKYGDPEDGKVVGYCRYCRKKFVKPQNLKTWETWAGTVVIPNDTRFKRSYPDATSDF